MSDFIYSVAACKHVLVPSCKLLSWACAMRRRNGTQQSLLQVFIRTQLYERNHILHKRRITGESDGSFTGEPKLLLGHPEKFVEDTVMEVRQGHLEASAVNCVDHKMPLLSDQWRRRRRWDSPSPNRSHLNQLLGAEHFPRLVFSPSFLLQFLEEVCLFWGEGDGSGDPYIARRLGRISPTEFWFIVSDFLGTLEIIGPGIIGSDFFHVPKNVISYWWENRGCPNLNGGQVFLWSEIMVTSPYLNESRKLDALCTKGTLTAPPVDASLNFSKQGWKNPLSNLIGTFLPCCHFLLCFIRWCEC